MQPERRQLCEVRAEGRQVSGVLLRYGETSPSHRERFAPGALAWEGPLALNLDHDPERAIAWLPDGGLELRANAAGVELVAVLPPIPAADRALAEIRAGERTGLSVEFHAERETRADGVRVIEAARLVGAGLVRSPSYPGSRIEARAAAHRAAIWEALK